MMKKLLSNRVRLLVKYGLSAAATTFAVGAFALNDSGMTFCYTDSQFATTCTAAVISDTGSHPRQDARLGRDANTSPGKIGGGDAGFDFTKISNAGNALPANAVLGTATNNWACSRDNVTSLVWEVKTSNPSTPGLRDAANTYTWYNPDASSNGGDAGSTGNATSCNSTLTACNTQDYVAAVNSANLCGRSDWRLPSYKEAWSIFNAQIVGAPPFDSIYFLSRGTAMFTSNTVPQQSNAAFFVDSSGMTFTSKTSLPRPVRLVAGTYAYQ
jgi:Protein of unknown function (DUF1566)